MKIKKAIRFLCVALCCMSLCLSAGGCGGNVFRFEQTDLDKAMEQELADVDFAANGEFEGKLRIARNSEPDQIAILDTLVAGFTAKYPKIEVEVVPYASAAYKDTLKNANSAVTLNGKYETFPDVFWASNSDLTEYQTLDMVMPIDYFDDKDDSVSLDDLVDAMVADCTIGGHTYLMPRDFDRLAMYYNKDYIPDGVEIPSDRALTKAEFLDLLDKVKGQHTTLDGVQKDVSALDAFWSWESLLWPLLYSYGGEVVKVDENGNTVAALDSPQTLEAFKFVKELNTSGYTTDVGGTGNYWLFKNKCAVLLFGVRATLSEIAANIPNLGVAPMPNLCDDESKYFVCAGCSGYAMYRHAANKTAAWLFQKYVVSAEGQNSISKTGNNIPVLSSLFTDTNAEWRKVAVNGDTSFNHPAFVYKVDTATITAQTGYRERIRPFNAIPGVSKEFLECIKVCVNNTKKTGYETAMGRLIRASHKAIDEAIALAKAGGNG